MKNSKKGLNYSLIAILLFVMAFIAQFLTMNSSLEFMNIAIVVTVLISFILAILGGTYSLFGLREESSKEEIIGLIISSIFLMIFIVFAVKLTEII